MPPDLRLGVLDQSPIAEGATGSEALRNTLDLARRADALGFSRYWVAEHHGGPMHAGTSPEALIGAIAASTSRLRVGAGGVMLPHYSPFKVAETFSVLSGLFADRIDLGIGRTDGTDDPVTAFALQRDRNHPAPEDFGDQLAELLALVRGELPEGHLFEALQGLLPGRPEGPEPWLLGSSAQSAIWAGELGMPYAFADFINPGAGVDLVNLYRERFTPGPWLGEPRVLVAAWALCADDDAQAERLASSAIMASLSSRRGRPIAVPPVDRALAFLARRGPSRVAELARRRRMVFGSPDTVRSALEAVAADYATPELLVVCVAHDHAARRRSYELLAEAFALAPCAAGSA